MRAELMLFDLRQNDLEKKYLNLSLQEGRINKNLRMFI